MTRTRIHAKRESMKKMPYSNGQEKRECEIEREKRPHGKHQKQEKPHPAFVNY